MKEVVVLRFLAQLGGVAHKVYPALLLLNPQVTVKLRCYLGLEVILLQHHVRCMGCGARESCK